MFSLNQPPVVAAVTAAFEAYEAALLANDVDALQGFFWENAAAVRFGVSEELYGYEAIADFRQGRVPNFSFRRPIRLTVTTFGEAFATVMFEYATDPDGQERVGRQSQTWILWEGEWKIVAAHISFATEASTPTTAYVAASLAALGLAPDPAWRPAIEGNFATTARLAADLMAFPLPPATEPAPVFIP